MPVLQVLRHLFNLFLRKKREISIFVLFDSVIKMCKVAPNCLTHLKVEIILFWHCGHYKKNFYLVSQKLICSTSNSTSKVVMLNRRGQGKNTLKHQLINENLLLKVRIFSLLHLVPQVSWKQLKLQWLWGKIIYLLQPI